MSLDFDKQEKRISKIIGLDENNELPDVSDETMKAFHKYLCENLELPFTATFEEETGPMESTQYLVKITSLLDFEDHDDLEFDGLYGKGKQGREEIVIPLAELTVTEEESRNFQLIDDYCSWFWNYR